MILPGRRQHKTPPLLRRGRAAQTGAAQLPLIYRNPDGQFYEKLALTASQWWIGQPPEESSLLNLIEGRSSTQLSAVRSPGDELKALALGSITISWIWTHPNHPNHLWLHDPTGHQMTPVSSTASSWRRGQSGHPLLITYSQLPLPARQISVQQARILTAWTHSISPGQGATFLELILGLSRLRGKHGRHAAQRLATELMTSDTADKVPCASFTSKRRMLTASWPQISGPQGSGQLVTSVAGRRGRSNRLIGIDTWPAERNRPWREQPGWNDLVTWAHGRFTPGPHQRSRAPQPRHIWIPGSTSLSSAKVKQ